MNTEIFNIDNVWDCDSINQRLHELYDALNYPIDYNAEVHAKIDILEQRKVELGC